MSLVTPCEVKSWSQSAGAPHAESWAAGVAAGDHAMQLQGTCTSTPVIRTQTVPACDAGLRTAAAQVRVQIDRLEVQTPASCGSTLTFAPRSTHNPWQAATLTKPATAPVGWCLKEVHVSLSRNGEPLPCPQTGMPGGAGFNSETGGACVYTRMGWQRVTYWLGLSLFHKRLFSVPTGMRWHRPKATSEPIYREGMAAFGAFGAQKLSVTKGYQDPKQPVWVAERALRPWDLVETFGAGWIVADLEGAPGETQELTLQADCTWQRYNVMGTGKRARYEEEVVQLRAEHVLRAQLPALEAPLLGVAVGADEAL